MVIEDKVTLIKELTDEYIKNDGYVTCEFSTDLLTPDLIRAFDHANWRLESYPRLEARWNVFYCSTCASHDPKFPLHCEIGVIENEDNKN